MKSMAKSSLLFVNSVNFELTYRCSYNCAHCLQKNIKHEPVVELSTEEVKTTIFDAHTLGLCSLGINYTGGELLGNRDDIFEILEYTRSLGIMYRLNTNSWWANGEDFNIGKQHFSTARDFVRYMKSLGLKIFAFSCDLRLRSSKNKGNLISSVKLCEEAGITYQLIFTGMGNDDYFKLIYSLKKECGRLNYMIPVNMEMVDIGGAAEIGKKKFCEQSNKSYCNKKGFYRPTTLHISPDGKVRTCLYAIGLNNCGSLREMTLNDIVKKFPHRANNEIFSNPEKFLKAEKELLKPYLHYYHPIIHECTRYIIIARAAEMTTEHPEMSMDEIHRIIAQAISSNKNVSLFTNFLSLFSYC
jgi:MoaA/NifB/PqqE/SkfB family radical SAM enzyme